MKSLGSALGRALLHGGWKAFRLFLQHPAAITIAILSLLTFHSAFRIWRRGFPAAISILPSLATYLILIVVVSLLRKKIRTSASGAISRGRVSLQRHMAQEVMEKGRSRGEAALKRGAEELQGAMSTLAQEVKADWEGLVQRNTPSGLVSPQLGPRCPSCGRILRMGARFCDGCGMPLPTTCPRCGRTLRPKARFCDGCGSPIHPIV